MSIRIVRQAVAFSLFAVLVPAFEANGVAVALGIAGAVSLAVLATLWTRAEGTRAANDGRAAPERALRTQDGR